MLHPEREPWFEVYAQEYEKHDLALKQIISIATEDLYLNKPPLLDLLRKVINIRS